MDLGEIERIYIVEPIRGPREAPAPREEPLPEREPVPVKEPEKVPA